MVLGQWLLLPATPWVVVCRAWTLLQTTGRALLPQCTCSFRCLTPSLGIYIKRGTFAAIASHEHSFPSAASTRRSIIWSPSLTTIWSPSPLHALVAGPLHDVCSLGREATSRHPKPAKRPNSRLHAYVTEVRSYVLVILHLPSLEGSIHPTPPLIM